MKAVILSSGQEPVRLERADVPEPKVDARHLIVQVAAVGVNRADLRLDRGHFGQNPQSIAGSEFSGTVVAMGEGCAGFKVGDRVMALAPACYAELATVRYEMALHVPEEMELQTAASIPAWYVTAHDALVTQGRLQAGESVLVQGVTSGVGIAAAQLARFFGAGKVVGVARSQEKLARLAQFIDSLDIVRLEADWPAKVVDLTGPGANLIVDLVGGGVLDGNLKCAAIEARLVAVGRLGGQADVLDINQLAFKRLQIQGVTFRSRTIEQKAAIVRAFKHDVLPALAEGKIRPLLDRAFNFEEATEAQAYMQENKHLGKVTIKVDL